MTRSTILRRWGLAGCAVALLVVLVAPADAAIYWGNGSPIGRAALDGSSVEASFIGYNPNPVGGQGIACGGTAVDASYVYWTEPVHGTIGRAKVDGSEANYSWITGASNPCGVTVDGSHVYWANFTGNTIGRANLDGSEPDQAFVSGTGDTCGVAVDSKFIYWASASGHYVSRALRQSGDTGPHLIDGDAASDFCGVAVDGEHLFWGGFEDAIGRMNLNGSDPEPSFITGLESPCGIAAYGGRIYWVESWAMGRVGSASADGTDVTRGILTGGGHPCGIAVDGLGVTRPVPLPPSQFGIGKARYDRKRGVVFLPLDLPDAGYLHVRPSAGMAWTLLPDRTKSEALSSGGRKWLKLWPGGKGSNSRRIRRELRRRGRTSFVVEIEYGANGHDLTRKGKRVSLFESRRASRSS
jgi:virginiamycin B lyase